MNKRARSAWLFLTPALLFYAIFLIFPVLSSLYLSLHEWNMLTSPLDAKYVGWSNYSYIFTKDKVFLKALGNTFIYAMSAVSYTHLLRYEKIDGCFYRVGSPDGVVYIFCFIAGKDQADTLHSH